MSFFGDVIDAIGDFFKSIANAIESLFSSNPVASPVKPCPKCLTEKEAQELFDHLKNRKDIPFDYPVDCCFTRAQMMLDDPKMQALAARGVPVGKAWNYAAPGQTLYVESPNGMVQPDGTRAVAWGYHVAPVVPVRGTDGVVRNMVIDPSMESGPVTAEEWAEHQKKNSSDKNTLALSGPDPYYRTSDGRTMPRASAEQVEKNLAYHRAKRAELQSMKLL